MRQVSGALFVDYVAMIRRRKDVAWERHLEAEDLPFLRESIDSESWYPMATFERFGNAIFAEIAGGRLEAVRTWGRLSVASLHASHPQMIAEGDPLESLMRVQVLRGTFFDFPAYKAIMLTPENAHIAINYHMGARAEEAAAHQAMGFFEGVLEVAGAKRFYVSLAERAWAGDDDTLLDLAWEV